MDHFTAEEVADIARQAAETKEKEYQRRMIIFAGLIVVATFAALGALTYWHAGLISRGETSIEARINSTEFAKYKAEGRIYENPYDFGTKENWRIFLGLKGRNWRNVLLPSTHGPYGNGLTWETIHDKRENAANIEFTLCSRKS